MSSGLDGLSIWVGLEDGRGPWRYSSWRCQGARWICHTLTCSNLTLCLTFGMWVDSLERREMENSRPGRGPVPKGGRLRIVQLSASTIQVTTSTSTGARPRRCRVQISEPGKCEDLVSIAVFCSEACLGLYLTIGIVSCALSCSRSSRTMASYNDSLCFPPHSPPALHAPRSVPTLSSHRPVANIRFAFAG